MAASLAISLSQPHTHTKSKPFPLTLERTKDISLTTRMRKATNHSMSHKALCYVQVILHNTKCLSFCRKTDKRVTAIENHASPHHWTAKKSTALATPPFSSIHSQAGFAVTPQWLLKLTPTHTHTHLFTHITHMDAQRWAHRHTQQKQINTPTHFQNIHVWHRLCDPLENSRHTPGITNILYALKALVWPYIYTALALSCLEIPSAPGRSYHDDTDLI